LKKKAGGKTPARTPCQLPPIVCRRLVPCRDGGTPPLHDRSVDNDPRTDDGPHRPNSTIGEVFYG